MYLNEIIRRELKKIDKAITTMQEKLDTFNDLRQGTLICKPQGFHTYYYYLQTCVHGKSSRVYLGKDDLEIVRRYKKQRFYREKLKRMETNKAVLNKCLKQLTDYSTEAIYHDLPSAYKNLPEECYVDDSFTELKAWANEKYERNPYPLPTDPNITCDGTPTRSKGESLIYDDLYFMDTPNRYDPKIRLKGRSGVYHYLYPDYLFHDSVGKPYAWEHLGMMDLEQYAERLKNKIVEYIDCGFIPGDNLFFTSDNIENNTNELMVMDMIDFINKKIRR